MKSPRAKVSDPWSSVHQDDKEKIQTWIPRESKIFLLSIDPIRGTMQSTINQLLKGLIDECRANGITSYERIDDFCATVLRRSTFTLPHGHQQPTGFVHADTGGNPHMDDTDTQRSYVGPNLKSGNPERQTSGKIHPKKGSKNP